MADTIGISAGLTALVMGLSFAAPADPYLDESLQRDVIAWHLSQGAAPADACAAITRYTGRDCSAMGREFTITSGANLTTTYLLTLKFPEPERTP